MLITSLFLLFLAKQIVMDNTKQIQSIKSLVQQISAGYDKSSTLGGLWNAVLQEFSLVKIK